MLNLKKTAVAVLAFGSSAVFAGTMGPVCTPGSVTVPCPRTAWDFGAQALYLQPSYLGLDYAGSVVNGSNDTESFRKNANHWGWGFQIEGSYHFNTGNDLDLNWYHLDRSRDQAVALGAGQVFFDSYTQTFGGPAATTVSINGGSKWDAVNLEFGQHVDMGEFVSTRFHGGVEFARMRVTSTENGSLGVANGTSFNPLTGAFSSSAPTGASQRVSSTNSYNGFGPRVGTDLGYGWNNGLSVYAKGAMSLLVGQSKFTRVSTFAINGVGSTSGSITTVNPELEAKLGAVYTYAMAQGDLSLDLGWMWVNYFSVLHDASTSLAGNGQRISDFGLQGPYVGLKWVGNVA